MVIPGADSRLPALRRVKLRALVAAHWSIEGPHEDGGTPGGATLQAPGSRQGWVLVDDGDPRGLGAALAWGRRRSIDDLHVLVEDRGRDASGIVARRAALFSQAPTVWRVEDRTLQPAVPAPPAPDEDESQVPVDVLDAYSAEMDAHGVVPIIEHGTLHGEVLGLEVARVVPDDAGAWRLAVGVGRHDREARDELRPGEPTGEALDDVVALVRQWRTAPDRRHPANTLARERLLRAAVIARPELAGAASLAPIPNPIPVDDLRRSAPAGALGLDPAGNPVVVVCSTGIDVDLVPTAADIRLLHAPDAALVLVLPAPDAYPLTLELAAALRRPAEVRTVGEDWPQLAS